MFAAVALAGGSAAHAEDANFAVVDTSALLGELMDASGVREKLEGEKEKLQRQLEASAEKAENARDELEKSKLTLSQIEIRRRSREVARMQNEAQLMQRQFQEELDQFEQEEMLLLRNELTSMIGDYVKKKRFDIIFYSDSLAGYKEGYDITEEILKEIRSQYKKKKRKK